MTSIRWLNFQPLFGISSKHLQTILPTLRLVTSPPESTRWIVELGGGDSLACEISTPLNWKPTDQSVMMLHGLGGSHEAKYMIRLAKAAHQKGYRAIRVNLRGCGSGQGLSKRPYHAGCSDDILEVVKKYKKVAPFSDLTLVGYSLGGNVILKFAGELGEAANRWVKRCVAVCSPLDLKQTVVAIGKKTHFFYEKHFLRSLALQTKSWIEQKASSIYEFDQTVTAPLCGFKNADHYYELCSSQFFLHQIRCPTEILLAEDDPFINPLPIQTISLHSSVNVWQTKFGGHMGFLGRNAAEYDYYWLDQLLLNWLEGDFVSDLCQ